MKIVFLDAKSIGEDIDLSGYDKLGEIVKYDFTTPHEVPGRVMDADVLVLNKVPINEDTIGKAQRLKLVCVTATGTDNLDKEYLKQRGIAWRNVAGYSTESVAQHTFALLFYLAERMSYYDGYVKEEHYVGDTMFTHFDRVFHEICGKTWGIIGLGNIGRRVADIAGAFGCRVIYFSTTGQNTQPGYERVELDALLQQADMVSVHAPLNENTRGLMNREAFRKMKRSAFFLNLGRGPIVAEEDLAWAIENGEIAGAGLDVLCDEPMSLENPLRKIKDSERLVITPHIAWASVEARSRLMTIIEGQIKDFFKSYIPEESLKEMCEYLAELTGGGVKVHEAGLETYHVTVPGMSWYHRSCLGHGEESNIKQMIQATVQTDVPLVSYTAENMEADPAPLLEQEGFVNISVQAGMVYDLKENHGFTQAEEGEQGTGLFRVGKEGLKEWLNVGHLAFDKPREQSLEAMIDREDCYFYAYQEKGKFLGTILLYGKEENGGIHEMAVLPECRRRGIARKLVNHALNQARALGMRVVSLQASEMGEALYKSMGFERVSTISTWVKKPAQ